MNWILPIGIGAAVVALVINAKKKDDSPSVPRFNRDDIRRRSPGQPQPVNYIRNLRYNPNG